MYFATSSRARTLALAVMFMGVCVLAQTNISMSYKVATQQNLVTVPTADLASIKSYSIGGWIRPSMTMDTDLPWATYFDKYSLISGVSTSKTGWGDNLKGSDAFLNAYLSKQSEKSAIVLGYDNDKDFSYLRLDISYDAIFGRWHFFYGAYHKDLNVQFLAVYSAFSDSWQTAWSNNQVVKHPIVDFFQFSVGSTDVKKSSQINGYVFDPTFTYSPSATYYKSVDDLKTFLAARKTPKFIGVNSKVEFTALSKASVTAAAQQILSNYQGADEYCVSGTFVFNGKPSSVAGQIVFRVSTISPVSTTVLTSYALGTRTLSLSVEGGKLYFSSYSLTSDKNTLTDVRLYQFVVSGAKVAIPILDNVEYYFYQGYSRAQKKVFSYIRVNNVDYYQVSTAVVHPDPNVFYVLVGADEIYKRNAPVTMSLSMEFGPGAYRETLITVAPTPKPVTVVDPVVIPSTYITPAVVSSNPSLQKPLDARTVSAQYIPVLESAAVHFWFRRDLNQPVFSDLNKARSQQILGGLSLKDTYASDLSLTVQYRSHGVGSLPAYQFVGSNTAGTVKKDVEFNLIQDQSNWHWIYLAFNKTQSTLTYTVDFNNGTITTDAVPYDLSSIPSLQFILGSDGTNSPVSGEFYDVQFVYHKESFVRDAAGMQQYIKDHRASPPARAAPSGQYEVTPDQFPIATYTTEATYANSYAIGGWAKFDKTTEFSEAGTVLFQLSINKSVADTNIERLGDQALEITINQHSVTFSTYKWGYTADQDQQTNSQTVAIDYFAGVWCIYYFGYSRTAQTASGSVTCDSGFSGEVVFKNLDHIVPTQASAYIGKSYGRDSFVGQVSTPFVWFNYELLLGKNYPEDLKTKRPAKDTCAVIFQECGFESELYTVCQSMPEIDLSSIKSLYVPMDYQLRFYKQSNYNGLNIKFVATVSCLDQTLLDQPELEWKALETLFNQGKIVFSNDNDQEISLEDAKSQYFSNVQKKVTHLRKGTTQETI